ncbi:mannitol dehydrogenase family protein [Mesorhizobium sp. NBSH29]|nr:mannitol dehydrogenase family protein [Mesorhizobium sp. NBSH29]
MCCRWICRRRHKGGISDAFKQREDSVNQAPTRRLSNLVLGSVAKPIETPLYDRSSVTAGIVHLGLGAFHRAHQAAYVDACINAGEAGWGIVGISLRSADTRDALHPQDGLYTLAVGDGDGESLQVIGSIVRTLVAPDDPGAVIAELSNPSIRIVTLTVTEKAYLRNAAGGLDTSHGGIQWDLANPDRPQTLYGFLAEALVRRRLAGTPPFTVLCCDNLPANGATLRRLMIGFFALRGQEQLGQSGLDVAFPSCMVDRIVPATTDGDRARISAKLGADDAWPVITEPFSQWVIEDHFPTGRPDWERFGVTMVDDVGASELMKLRLLNGAHSGIAFLGLLSGHETVAEAFADVAIRGFIDALWSEAVLTLPNDAGLDTTRYTQELAKRFSNTALQHRIAQIANDSSQKLPQRIISSALERAEKGLGIDHLMLVVAAWVACCAARGGTFAKDHFTDPLDDRLAEIAANRLPAEAIGQAFEAAGFAKDSAHRATLIGVAAAHLKAIQANGIAATLAHIKEN